MSSTTEVKALPPNLAYSFMTPCSTRGRLHPALYVVELVIAAFAMIVIGDVFIWIGSVFAVHALYRLSNMKKLKAACPSCQKIQKQLVENGKSYKCKSCGHQLGIYGTKLADLDTLASGAGGPVASPSPVVQQKASSEEKSKAFAALVSLLLIGGWFYYCFGGGLEKQANGSLQKIKNSVASDAAVQYGIAARNGDKMDKCAQAGMVMAAYLQAQDEANYAHWKETQRRDCAAAGIPVQ